jgi:Methane oxygenase PmoA
MLALVLSSAAGSPILAQEKAYTITVAGGKEDATNVPICVPMEVSALFAKATHVGLQAAGSKEAMVGQFTAPGIVTESLAPKDKALVRRDLHFILPILKAGSTFTATLAPMSPPPTSVSKEFHWKDTKGENMELLRGNQPILRYVYKAYDNSTPANREKTYKVFHHVFEPNGTRLITNGGDADPENAVKKLYPHHRGLMFAFNKITQFDAQGNKISYLDEKGKMVNTFDTWHTKPRDTHESHDTFLSSEAGQVLGRHRVGINWHNPDNKVFAKEEREMTVYGIDGGTLIEFATRLKTLGGKVKLDGDPQHSGFQFRAHNDVSEKNTAKQTYYLRPDGKGSLGDTRNWGDPKSKQFNTINLPWDVMSFVLYGKRFSVAYLDNPANPGEKRYSERDYGRFGCYFEYDLTPEHPLVLNHRIWLQNGEMTGDQARALSAEFAAPPKVTWK